MRLRASALVASLGLAILLPFAIAAGPGQASLELSGPSRAVVRDEQTLHLTLTLAIQGVSCLDEGTAVAHLMVAKADGYNAQLDAKTVEFVLPKGDWTTKPHVASAPVNLTVRGSAETGLVRVTTWVAAEDVSGCFALMGLEGSRADHEVALTAQTRASSPPSGPRDSPAPPAPPARPEEAPQRPQEPEVTPQESSEDASGTRPIALRGDPLPGPVIMLFVIAAAGAFAVVMQRRTQRA